MRGIACEPKFQANLQLTAELHSRLPAPCLKQASTLSQSVLDQEQALGVAKFPSCPKHDAVDIISGWRTVED